MPHGTLLNIIWQPEWEEDLRAMDTCVYMAESPKLSQHCLLIGYNPKQN